MSGHCDECYEFFRECQCINPSWCKKALKKNSKKAPQYKIKPCHWCKGEKLRAEKDTGESWVVCDSCGVAVISGGKTMKYAIDVWNSIRVKL